MTLFRTRCQACHASAQPRAGFSFASRQDLIDKLTSGTIRFVSMVCTGRSIRLFGSFAIVHGSEQDVIEQNGERLAVDYRYMDVVIRREGRWQIVASQLGKIG